MSVGVSPLPRPNWREYNMNARSPSGDSISNMLVLDPELFLQSKASGKAHAEMARPANEDDISIDSRSQRGSYDQAMFGGDETEFGNDDFNLPHRIRRQDSGQGLKRRALSPPTDGTREEKSPAYSNLANKFAGQVTARSPATSYRQYSNYGSVSSVASSVRQPSHASSFAPSIAGSSMTSISSYDRPSPCDSNQAQLFVASAGPLSPASATSVPPFRKPASFVPGDLQDSDTISRKMSIQTAVNDARSLPATKIGNHFMCDCCPKKPRKFESENDLRQVPPVQQVLITSLFTELTIFLALCP